MPRLSDSMEEGTVLKWLKSVGDEVAVGDELVEIETDKANMVYESDLAGTLVELLAQEGDTLPVGDPIARVGDASEVQAGGNGGAPKSEPAPEPEAPPLPTELPAPAATEAPPSAAAVGGDGRVKASPIGSVAPSSATISVSVPAMSAS